MHSDTGWPMRGRYICPSCGRVYRVAWEDTPRAVQYGRAPRKAAVRFDVRSRSGRLLLNGAAMLWSALVALTRSDTM